MLVSIIITTKNQKSFLEKSIPAIFNQTHKNLEVIIVDSGSTDGALDLIKKFTTQIINIPPQSFNYALAFNEGVKRSKGEILVKLSGDVIPGTNKWLSFLLENFKNPKVGVVFGKPKPYPQDSLFDQIFLNIAITFLFGNKKRTYKTGSAVAGGNMALRKNLWEKFPLDKSLSRAEDRLFTGQIHKIGYLSIYEPRAWVYHNHGVINPLIDIIKNIQPFLSIKQKLSRI